MLGSIKYLLVIVTATVIGAKVHINNVQLCENKEYTMMWIAKVRDDGDKQMVDGYLDTKIDINNDVQNKVEVYQQENGKWNLIATKTDGTCTMIEMFLGEFVRGLENSAGLKQTCPYPKGKYDIKNHALDFSNFKYKDFPPGDIKIRSEFFAKSDEKNLLSCFEIEFSLNK